MPKFFVDHLSSEDSQITITGQQAEHLRVLRLRAGDPVMLCDGKGLDYQAELLDIHSGLAVLAIQSHIPSQSEPKISCTVYMSFSKGDKLEHVIQKATELGANSVVAFPSSRSVAKYDGRTLEKKLPRWQKIADSAAEQAGRGRIPSVQAANSYSEAIRMAAQADRGLFFYENEHAHTLTAALTGSFQTVSIVTGPEGGFSPEETDLAAAAGLQICTLGRRILRCETAPLCALSAVMYAAGEY